MISSDGRGGADYRADGEYTRMSAEFWKVSCLRKASAIAFWASWVDDHTVTRDTIFIGIPMKVGTSLSEAMTGNTV